MIRFRSEALTNLGYPKTGGAEVLKWTTTCRSFCGWALVAGGDVVPLNFCTSKESRNTMREEDQHGCYRSNGDVQRGTLPEADSVPQDVIERVIYAATRASSPGNSQARDFIVVRDRSLSRKFAI
jgi:hypothetical protein